MKVIGRGAEAVLRLEERPEGRVLVKDRVRKGYRVPDLDERIRSQRTGTEERMLSKARRAGVGAPMVLGVSGSRLEMEFVEGPTLKECLNGLGKKQRTEACEQVGRATALLHGAGIMHGDLTTSNMVLKGGNPSDLFVIDFGLAKSTRRTEDQAVDLFLLSEALKAAHYRFMEECWGNIIKAYKYNYSIADKVLERLVKIEKRRRYRGE
jgi:TP53 regulating kinase and related kinases